MVTQATTVSYLQTRFFIERARLPCKNPIISLQHLKEVLGKNIDKLPTLSNHARKTR